MHEAPAAARLTLLPPADGELLAVRDADAQALRRAAQTEVPRGGLPVGRAWQRDVRVRMPPQDHLLTHENDRIDGQRQTMPAGDPQHRRLKQRMGLEKMQLAGVPQGDAVPIPQQVRRLLHPPTVEENIVMARFQPKPLAIEAKLRLAAG